MSAVAMYEDPELTPEQVSLIKSQICKGASDDELKLFLYTAKRAGIDPLLKQIYAVRRGGNMVIQMGIDGFRAIASKQGDYLPGDESFEYDKDGNLLSATVSVYKLLPNGQPHKFSKAAYWVEFAQYQYNKQTGKKELSQFWKQFPRVMLAKCAEAAALRKGWPHVFGKIYAPEELNQAVEQPQTEEAEITITPEEKKKEPQVFLSIPNGVNEGDVEEYFQKVAQEFEKPVAYFKQRAANDPKKFWENFHIWNNAQHPESEVAYG